MTTHDRGQALIKSFEALRLTAYRDAAGVWTIGYGHTATAQAGQRITAAEAEALFAADLARAEAAVRRALSVSLNANEFAALVSLVFNIGAAAFSRSRVRRLLAAGDRPGAAEAILLWCKATVRGRKVTLPGLVRRRAAERALFLEPVA